MDIKSPGKSTPRDVAGGLRYGTAGDTTHSPRARAPKPPERVFFGTGSVKHYRWIRDSRTGRLPLLPRCSSTAGPCDGDQLHPCLRLAQWRPARGDTDITVCTAGDLTGIRQQYSPLSRKR